MPTSVHIPREVLAAVDRRARSLRVSRNRFILDALRRELARETEWSPGFFESLQGIDPKDSRALEKSLAAVKASRSSKRPPKL
jgi:metal-responsive CopG/Arc/MetJ family transcriptional regulator